jgi:hypothetical protein
MGTSGAYAGSGGKDGKAARDAISNHLAGLAGPGAPPGSDPGRPPLDPAALRGILNLLRPRQPGGGSSDGPGAGGGGGAAGGTGSRSGGGPQRTAAASARTGGRSAAAAYAYRTGDAATLQRLGLDYQELRGLDDDMEVVRRITEMACSAADSTILDHEQRWIAASVAEWVITLEQDGPAPTAEEIVRQTIATIIAETALVETGDLVNHHAQADLAESDIRDAAEALAAQATLSVNGASEQEISRAVEAGLETIRMIIGKGP